MAIVVERLTAEIDADPAKAIAGLEVFSAATDKAATDKTANIDVDTAKADAQLALFSLEADKATRDRTLNINVDKDRGIGGFTGAISALEGMLTQVPGELENVGKGFGNVTQLADEAATSLGSGGGGFTGAISKAGSAAAEFAMGLGPVLSAVGGLLMPAVIFTLVTVLPGAFAAAAAGAAVLTGALVPLLGLLGAIPVAIGALGAVFGVVAGAILPVIAGLSAYGKATQGAAQQSDQLAQRQHALVMANQAVAASIHGVQQAEQALADARKNLKAAPAQAEEALRQAHFDAAQAAINEKQAVLALVDAQKNLRDAQNATSDSMVTTTKQTDYFTGKVYEVAIASKSAVSNAQNEQKARLAVRQAELNLAEARDASAQAQQHLAEMEAKGIKNSDIMVQARRQLAQAEYSLKQARQAETNAIYNQTQAQKALTQSSMIGTAATNAWTQAQKHLSAEGISFVKFLHDDFMPGLWDLSKAAQNGLLPGVEDGLKRLHVYFPIIKQDVSSLSGLLGTAFDQMAKFWSRPKQQQLLQEDFDGLFHVIKAGLGVLRPFSVIMAQLVKDASPMVVTLFKGITASLDHLSAWLNSRRGQRETTKFFSDAAKFAGLWAEVLKPILPIFLGISKAVAPLAETFLKDAAGWMQNIADNVNSKSGQQTIFDYVTAQLPSIKEIGGILHDIVGILFNSSKGGKDSSFYRFLHEIRYQLLPEIEHIFRGLDKSTTGGDLVDGLTALLKGLEHVDWKTLGSNVHSIAQSLLDIANFVNWLDGKGGHASLSGVFLGFLGPGGSALNLLKDFRDMLSGKMPDAFKTAWNAGVDAGQHIRGAFDGMAHWFKTNVIDPLTSMFRNFFEKILPDMASAAWKGITDSIPGPIKKALGFGADIASHIPKPSLPFGLGRWSGGPVEKDHTYLVGEKGPELFTPSSGGRIAPHSTAAPLIQSTKAGIDPAMLDDLVRKIAEQMKPDVKVEQTFNEKIDPMHVAKELAWEIAGAS